MLIVPCAKLKTVKKKMEEYKVSQNFLSPQLIKVLFLPFVTFYHFHFE